MHANVVDERDGGCSAGEEDVGVRGVVVSDVGVVPPVVLVPTDDLETRCESAAARHGWTRARSVRTIPEAWGARIAKRILNAIVLVLMF